MTFCPLHLLYLQMEFRANSFCILFKWYQYHWQLFFFSFQNILAKNFFNLNKIQIGFSRNVNTWCLLNSVFSNIVWILSAKNFNWKFSRNDKNVWCSLFQLLWALSFHFPPIRICICIIFKPQFNSNFWGQLHSSMIHRQLTQITQIQITHKQNSNF